MALRFFALDGIERRVRRDLGAGGTSPEVLSTRVAHDGSDHRVEFRLERLVPVRRFRPRFYGYLVRDPV